MAVLKHSSKCVADGAGLFLSFLSLNLRERCPDTLRSLRGNVNNDKRVQIEQNNQ